MAARIFTLMTTAFLLYSVASAADYCVAANRWINLRDAASLQGNVLETVAPGTTLSVIGEHSRWLKINRSGNEVWMANWVDYSRLDNCGGAVSQQGTSAETANIDNCCFVDRQCQTDQDWAEGYYAFQNNQCGAPQQMGVPTSTQRSSGAPAQIDNCCFVDRQCTSDLEWAEGYHAFQNNQCRAPGQTGAAASSRSAGALIIGSISGLSILPSTSYTLRPALGQTISFDNCCELNWQCNSERDWAEGYGAFQNNFQCALPGEVISIVGDPDFVDYLAQRLDQLRNRLPHRYSYVLSGLDKIQQAPDDLLAGHVDDIGRIFYVPWTGPRVDGWEKRLSAVLVHEACHVHRYAAGYSWNGCDPEAIIREETICREMELAVVIELDAPTDVIEWVRGMVARTRTGENLMLPGGC